MRLLATNLGPGSTLPANGSIELAFDRLLAPLSVTRQSFILGETGNPGNLTPTVAYDPVTRVVTITPLPDLPFQPHHNYELTIASPANDSDPNGLRTFDGARLDPNTQATIAFVATEPATVPVVPTIDFCRDIHPITSSTCSGPDCHTSIINPPPASGLILDPPSYIGLTAVGRVAQASNSGPRTVPQSLPRLFGEDMPIIDATGNAGQSFLLYKVLLATPSPAPIVADAGTMAPADSGGASADATVAGVDASVDDGGGIDGSVPDGGADAGRMFPRPIPAVDVRGAYDVAWQPLSDSERSALSNYIQGQEMPYPPLTGLDLDKLQRLSFWIAQGARAPASCP